MNLQEVKELRDLNVELLEDSLKILHGIDKYCDHFKIPLAFDADLQERIKKAVATIQRINGCLTPELDTRIGHHSD
jgi:predicted translin family RNA/ssDNA-binding protein